MTDDQNQEYQDRLKRLNQLHEKGINPFPARVDFNFTQIKEILTGFDKRKKIKEKISTVGRLRSKRLHGSLFFGDLEYDGSRIQLYVKENEIGKDTFQMLSKLIDTGDFIAVEGEATETKRGEDSILVSRIQLLAKSLKPLPEKWHGLQDIETRFRKRELDLLSNPDVKKIFSLRSAFLQHSRNFLYANDCLEVETPILQAIPGGATAKPFITHHNTLDQDMYLRIAPELYLKRLVVGGLPRVFEVARCFRNEGIDTQHNPEFTQIELYISYFDYRQLMEFTTTYLQDVIKKTYGSLDVEYQGTKLSFAGNFPEKTFSEVIKEYCDIDIESLDTDAKLQKAAKEKGVSVEKNWGRGKILDELFKKHARPHLIQPMFLTHHPLPLSPLAKIDSKDPNYVERFQLIVQGMEVCNGFSELNNPLEQKKRFEAQEKLRKDGDDEAQFMDEQYIESLEYGLPPTAGIGIGVDRFIQILTDSPNIKEVILFPTLRNKE